MFKSGLLVDESFEGNSFLEVFFPTDQLGRYLVGSLTDFIAFFF